MMSQARKLLCSGFETMPITTAAEYQPPLLTARIVLQYYIPCKSIFSGVKNVILIYVIKVRDT